MDEEYILYLKDCKNPASPICVDFSVYNTVNKSLIKACGVGKNSIVLDATAGLGRDSFIIANYAGNVTMLEKNPIIYSLLENGINRGLKNEKIQNIIRKMKLLNLDSIEFFKKTNDFFDCIYLDPMFDDSKKSRLVKKEMQIFHNLADNGDNKLLFDLSMEHSKRVVVKRALHSDFLVDYKCKFQIKEKTIRFDVYCK